jgi:flagellar basal-body rod protein FlgC
LAAEGEIMNPFERISAAAYSGMRAQAFRLRIVAENLANADTHGYRRKLVGFDEAHAGVDGAVRVSRVTLDPKTPAKIFDPSHPLADQEGYVAMSNVDAIVEFADAREAQRSYEAGLQIVGQARDMHRALLDILKR